MFPDASFLRKTAKLSGFGGIMEDRNNTFEENPATCSLKEAQLKVILLFEMTFMKYEKHPGNALRDSPSRRFPFEYDGEQSKGLAKGL